MLLLVEHLFPVILIVDTYKRMLATPLGVALLVDQIGQKCKSPPEADEISSSAG
jgi:hypothetical protein